MTAPIRSMAELLAGVRDAQVERGLSYVTIEHIVGMANGTVAKYLGEKPSKKLGPRSTFEILAALGKALAVVDDAERIREVKSRWKDRIIKGGATLQMQARENALASALASQEQGQIELRERMRVLGSMGGKKGGKRRLKTMSKRARQRAASHAARMRWAKRKAAD